MRLKNICLSILFLYLLGISGHASATQRILFKEVTLHHKSDCHQGARSSQSQMISIPSNAMLAFDKVEYEVLKDKGNTWKSSSYDPASKIVTVKVESQAHNDCFQVGGLWVDKDTSSISVKFKIYVLENACDALIPLPNEDSVSALEWKRLLEIRYRQEKCEADLTQILKKQAIKKTQDIILTKASLKSDLNNTILKSQIVQLKAMRSEFEMLRSRLISKGNAVNTLSDKLKTLLDAIKEAWNIENSTWVVERNLEAYNDALASHEKSKGSKWTNIHKEITGKDKPSPQKPPQAAIFDIAKWAKEVEIARDDFDKEYNFHIDDLKEFERKNSDIIRRLQAYFKNHDIHATIGFVALREELHSYKTTANNLVKEAFLNQENFKRLRDLHTKNLNEMLCKKLKDETYCKPSFAFKSDDTLYNPYPIIRAGTPPPNLPKGPKVPPMPLPRPGWKHLSGGFNSKSGVFSSTQNFARSSEGFTGYSSRVSNVIPGQICFTEITTVDPSGELSPSPTSPGEKFLSVNGFSVAFYEVIERRIYQNGKRVSAMAVGCIGKQALKSGNNQVTVNYRFGDGSYSVGSHTMTFYVNYGLSNQGIICSSSASGSTQGNYACSGSMTLDLADIDPELKKEIVSLQKDVLRLRQETLHARQSLNSILARLKDLELMDFDDLNPAVLTSISDELKDIAELIIEVRRDHSESVHAIQLEIAASINSMISPEEALKEALGRSHYGDEEDPLLKSAVIPNLELLEAKIKATYTGETGNELSKEVQQTYDKIYSEIVERIESSVRTKNFGAADEALNSWNNIQSHLLQRLNNRKAGPSELKAFHNFTEKVNKEVGKYFDKNGFALLAKIPSDIRAQISEAKNSSFANKIKIAMNKNEDDKLSVEQKSVQKDFYQMMRSYAEIFGYDKKNDIENEIKEPVRKGVESGLLQVAESGFRIGVSFTPVGKFVDFCELVTGKSLCLPNGEQLTTTDRALSGVGIVLGSGVLLRKVAKSSIIKDSVLLGEVMSSAVSSIGKLKNALKLTGDKLFESGSKILKVFIPVNESVPVAQLMARTESAVTKFLMNVKDVEIVESRTLNNLVKSRLENPKNFQTAFDPKYSAFRATLTRDHEYVRFIKQANDGTTRARGAWMISKEIVFGLTPSEIKTLLAIDYVPTHYSIVSIKEGVTLNMGRVASNKNGGGSGVMQIWLDSLDPIIEMGKIDFASPKRLESIFK